MAPVSSAEIAAGLPAARKKLSLDGWGLFQIETIPKSRLLTCTFLFIVFYEMRITGLWKSGCARGDMSMSLILFAAQFLVTVVAFVGEMHEDPRFADEKLIYRS